MLAYLAPGDEQNMGSLLKAILTTSLQPIMLLKRW
jgi:hypothetical protein